MASRNTSARGRRSPIGCTEAAADFLSAQTGAGVSLNTPPRTGVTGLHDLESVDHSSAASSGLY